MALYKKAQFRYVVRIIVFIAAFILVFLIVRELRAAMVGEFDEKTCATSVFSIDAIEKTRYDAELHLKCPFFLLGEIGAKKEKPELRKEFVMEEIAARMTAAWNTFGEGTKNTFQRKGPGGRRVHCMIWAEFELPPEVPRITHDEFTAHMRKPREKGGISPFNYLENGLPVIGGEKKFFVKGTGKKFEFEPFNELVGDTLYSVIFYAVPGGAITVAGWKVFHYDDQSSSIFITETKDIAHLGCEVLQG